MKTTQKTSSYSTKQQIILELKSAQIEKRYISGEIISKKYKINIATVRKYIKNLKKSGYKIISIPNKGFKLISVPNLLLPEELYAGLETKIIGSDIKYFHELASTNQTARELAEVGATDGTLVIAESQTAGRGRLGRFWASPQGGLWITMILRPDISPIHAPIITLLTGVSVAQTIQQITRLTPRLKWPNDVRLSGKKVCGILTELCAEQDHINYILVGVGLNLNINLDEFPKNLRASLTTLEKEFHKKINRIEFTQELLLEFEKNYLHFCQNPRKIIPEILNTWRSISDTIGKTVKVETITGPLTGLVIDISDDGAILVRKKNGEITKVLAGDCIYLK